MDGIATMNAWQDKLEKPKPRSFSVNSVILPKSVSNADGLIAVGQLIPQEVVAARVEWQLNDRDSASIARD